VVLGIDMGGMGEVDLDKVDMMVVNVRVTVAEVVGLVARIEDEDCLREVMEVDKDYLMKVEMAMEGWLLDDLTRFGCWTI